MSVEDVQRQIHAAAEDRAQVAMRSELARFAAQLLSDVGEELHVIGHIIGSDRVRGVSVGSHGSDEIVAVSLLCRIAGQLTSAMTDLFADGRRYAAAALLRQLVEVEYLAWAFATRDRDAERWLRSTPEERYQFFKPAKLRSASGGRFRSKDYTYHCELGGHPVPQSFSLFGENAAQTQLLMFDLVAHTGRIWDSILDWAGGQPLAQPVLRRKEEAFRRFGQWKEVDAMVKVPPPV